MPSRRRNIRRDGDFVTRAEFETLQAELRRISQSLPIWMERNPLDAEETYGFRFKGVAESSETVEIITDGLAPASSPTPTVAGGPRYLAIKIPTVANADLVTYEVHIGTAAAFATSAATLAAETPANIVYVRAVDGVDLAYDTDYYVKLIAKDGDGAAAVGAEVGPTRLDPNGTDDFLAGSVTAEKLSSVLALISALVAGTLGAQRVEVGFGTDALGEIDTSFIGIRAYAPDGETVTFSVDALTGEVYVKGRLDFGTGSRLLGDDIIEIAEQVSSGFQTPSRVQFPNASGEIADSGSASWSTPTTPGNELLLTVHVYLGGSTAPTITTPAGWTLAKSVSYAGGEGRLSIFRRTSTGQSGAQAVSWSANAHCWTIQMFEFSGVSDVEDGASATSTGTNAPAGSGTSGAMTQSGIAFAVIAAVNGGAIPDTFDFTGGFESAGYKSETRPGAFVFMHQRALWKIASASAQTAGCDLNPDPGVSWGGAIITLKAKAIGVESPQADRVRLYGKLVSSKTRLHTKDESGEESAIVLGMPDEAWRMEIVEVTRDTGSILNHDGGAYAETIPGLAVGDYCFFQSAGNASNQRVKYTTRPVCTVAGEITVDYFNFGPTTYDPASTTHYYLVFHRS